MNDQLCSGCWNGLCRLRGSFGYLNPQKNRWAVSTFMGWFMVMILLVIALDIITGNWALFQRDSLKRTDYSWRKTTWPLNNPRDKNRGAVAAGPHTGTLREAVFRSFVYRREESLWTTGPDITIFWTSCSWQCLPLGSAQAEVRRVPGSRQRLETRQTGS